MKRYLVQSLWNGWSTVFETDDKTEALTEMFRLARQTPSGEYRVFDTINYPTYRQEAK